MRNACDVFMVMPLQLTFASTLPLFLPFKAAFEETLRCNVDNTVVPDMVTLHL